MNTNSDLPDPQLVAALALSVALGGHVHWKQTIEKDFMGSWDLLDDNGKPRGDSVLLIESVKSEKLKTKETMKTHPNGKARCVIRFKGQPKGFVCNTTNCETIAALYGDQIEAWAGKRIALFVAKVRDPKTGGQIPGIRVREFVPEGQETQRKLDRPVNEGMRRAQDQAFGRGEQAPQRQPGED